MFPLRSITIARLNLKENSHLFEFISNQFSQLPLFFMDFHGEQMLENVLEVNMKKKKTLKSSIKIDVIFCVYKTMSKAVIIHDVNHIVIDNLQFMIGNHSTNHVFDK